VFALAIYGKNEKGNLSKVERNELARVLPKPGRRLQTEKG
jgi:hypothetical protein